MDVVGIYAYGEIHPRTGGQIGGFDADGKQQQGKTRVDRMHGVSLDGGVVRCLGRIQLRLQLSVLPVPAQ